MVCENLVLVIMCSCDHLLVDLWPVDCCLNWSLHLLVISGRFANTPIFSSLQLFDLLQDAAFTTSLIGQHTLQQLHIYVFLPLEQTSTHRKRKISSRVPLLLDWTWPGAIGHALMTCSFNCVYSLSNLLTSLLRLLPVGGLGHSLSIPY